MVKQDSEGKPHERFLSSREMCTLKISFHYLRIFIPHIVLLGKFEFKLWMLSICLFNTKQINSNWTEA